MARPSRANIACMPQHVVQRGNNRTSCFFADVDRRCYLFYLRQAATRFDCAVHAYVLMDNHVHLLVTPREAAGVSRMMQALGSCYVPYVNRSYDRTGTLWQGRFKSCLIDTETYLLACYRYIELNPVRAAIVHNPNQYQWSSYAANALGKYDAIVTPHDTYLELGQTSQLRQAAYRDLVHAGIDASRLSEIRSYLEQQKALGSTAFRSGLEARLARCMRVRAAHQSRTPP